MPVRLGQTCKTQTNFIGDCNPVMFDLHIIKLQTERERGGERERGRVMWPTNLWVLKRYTSTFFFGGGGGVHLCDFDINVNISNVFLI